MLRPARRCDQFQKPVRLQRKLFLRYFGNLSQLANALTFLPFHLFGHHALPHAPSLPRAMVRRIRGLKLERIDKGERIQIAASAISSWSET
jgi:hypothetical protein